MPFSKSQNITKPSDSTLKFLLLGNPVRCHNDKIHLVRTGSFFLGFFGFGQHREFQEAVNDSTLAGKFKILEFNQYLLF